MIKFEINAEENKLHFECKGEPADIAADAMVCLRRTYDAMKEVDDATADHMIAFIVAQLVNPLSDFYADVDWEDEEWEDTQC